MNFTVPADHKANLKEGEKKDKYLKPCYRTEKSMEYESDSDTNSNRRTWYSHQKIGKGTGGLGNKRTSEDYLNYSTVKIGQNTDKNPGDLM